MNGNRNAIPKRSVLNFKVNQKPIRMSAASFNGCHWHPLFRSPVAGPLGLGPFNHAD